MPILGTVLLAILICGIPGSAVVGVGIALRLYRIGTLLPNVLYLLLTFVFLVFGLYLSVSCLFIQPVMIVERHFGMPTLNRSREMVRGAWWRSAGIFVAAIVIAQAPATALRFVWGFIPIIGVILTALTQALSSTYSAVAITIYYFDRRCRVEDFDVRLLAEQVRAQSPGTIQTASQASAPA